MGGKYCAENIAAVDSVVGTKTYLCVLKVEVEKRD